MGAAVQHRISGRSSAFTRQSVAVLRDPAVIEKWKKICTEEYESMIIQFGFVGKHVFSFLFFQELFFFSIIL